jgi:uncharacterized protein (DUF697 family)
VTATRAQRTHGIIHVAAVAAAGIGAGLAQLPGADAPVLMGIQTTMIVALADEYGVTMSKTAAAELLLTLTATMAGRGISQWVGGWIPAFGNAINATTAGGITEAVGWLAVKYFSGDESPKQLAESVPA